jgi:hydrogenase nickel incorporation protein HypB
MSVTEGEDEPLKYPTIFNSSDIAIITKMDLADAVEFDYPGTYGNIQAVRPGMQVFQVSSKSGAGMQAFLELLAVNLAQTRATAAV